MVEELLKTIEREGYSCYIVGGYVRDQLMGIASKDIDITTSAPPEAIKKMFDLDSEPSYGCIDFKWKSYSVEITTYRKESNYQNRHPSVVEYTEDILEDLKRRDFTINAICMDSSGKIFDPLDGQNDLKTRKLRVIGDIGVKLREDPLRMLRAVRFATTHSLKIEISAEEFIKENGYLIRELSYERKKNELDKIFSSPNSEEGVLLLESLRLLEPLELHQKIEFVRSDLLGSWAEFDFPKEYPFKKCDRKKIEDISLILKSKIIDENTILTYGLSSVLTAGKILGFQEKDILETYKRMPIKRESDLAFDGQKLKELTNLDGKIIGTIKKDLLKEVLSGNLPNRCKDIEKYVIEKWK